MVGCQELYRSKRIDNQMLYIKPHNDRLYFPSAGKLSLPLATPKKFKNHRLIKLIIREKRKAFTEAIANICARSKGEPFTETNKNILCASVTAQRSLKQLKNQT